MAAKNVDEFTLYVSQDMEIKPPAEANHVCHMDLLLKGFKLGKNAINAVASFSGFWPTGVTVHQEPILP